MNPSHRIAAAALAAVVTLGTVSPVSAAKPPQQPFVAAESELLIRALKSTGHYFLTEESGPGAAHACESRGMLGAANGRKQVLVCVRNHNGRGGSDEMASTLRHESWHALQHCIARKEGRIDVQPVFLEDAEQNIAYARDVLRMPMDKYDRETWAAEAEARVMEYALDEVEVAFMLRKHCQL